jgi:AAA15 family ATPase/GTPase
MKITYLQLKNFKRFTNLEIENIPSSAKLVVLVGPNGSGKSSVFDAFEQMCEKPGRQEDPVYLRKDQSLDFDITLKAGESETYTNHLVRLDKQKVYIRSAYRVDSDFQIETITRKGSILTDELRPKKLIDLDKRVKDNYERLIGSSVEGLYSGDKDNLSVSGLREEIIGEVKSAMKKVFPDLLLESLGDPLTNGQFFFSKGDSKNFSYKNLSAGEKGAFDIILDLIIKKREYNDTIFVIDEPELHMHSMLQQKLLLELIELIPEGCQLWVATHSIGFIRGAIEAQKSSEGVVSIFDFDDYNFDSPIKLSPAALDAKMVQKMFAVALDDLANMVTPEHIIFCEGSLEEVASDAKKEFDAKVYNIIFPDKDALFISTDNKTLASKAGGFLIDILSKSGLTRRISSLVDRDNFTAEKITEVVAQHSYQKFLKRKEIENYLLSKEIIIKYCEANRVDIGKVTSFLSNEIDGSAKAAQSSIKDQCGYAGSVDDFKLELAKFITSETETYKELSQIIFN